MGRWEGQKEENSVHTNQRKREEKQEVNRSSRVSSVVVSSEKNPGAHMARGKKEQGKTKKK